MLKDWFTLISWTLSEYSRQQQGGLIVVLAIPFVIAALLSTGSFGLGRLIDARYCPSLSQAISQAVAALFTILTVLVWTGAPYIKPAIKKVIENWKSDYQNDSHWHHETYRQMYWAVKGLHGPDGSPVENFDGHPPPESPGSTIPITSSQARFATATIEASRVSEHFHVAHPLLQRILGAKEQPISEVLKQDIDSFFKQSPGENQYPRQRGSDLAGNRMFSILEEKLPYIVFRLRLIVAAMLAVIWLPLYAWRAYRAWKNLEPLT